VILCCGVVLCWFDLFCYLWGWDKWGCLGIGGILPDKKNAIKTEVPYNN
jgi:hypothetical protein